MLQSIRVGYLLASSRLFVVDDYFFPMYVIRPRRGTRFVQVWHGCGAFKKFGYSVLDKTFGADPDYIRVVAIHSNYDLCLVSSARFIPAYAEGFRQPPERFTAELGIPRTDLFFDPERVEAIRVDLRTKLGLTDDRRVVLYAPTFRGERVGLARDPLNLDLDAMAKALAGDHVVLLRSHPFVRERATEGMPPGFVIDVSDHPDINELMLVSDVLVTDYSSAMYEFSLLGRAMAFFAPDHDEYELERGFYFDYASGVPGPVFTETGQVIDWLRVGDFDVDRVRRFAAESFDVADGQSTRRFVDRVVRPALGRPPG